MTTKKTQPQKHIVLMTKDMDGACAAAMVLQKYPEADLQLTSQQNLHTDLDQLKEKHYDCIHVIGGLEDDFHHAENQAALKALREASKQVFQYDNARNSDQQQQNSTSHTEAVAKALDISTERSSFLQNLAREYIDASSAFGLEKVNKKFWHNYIKKVNHDWHQYGKVQPLYLAITQLATLAEKDVPEIDKKEVAHFAKHLSERRLLLGNSSKMSELRGQIKQASQQDKVSVVLLGESGTGKEIIAQAIHDTSKRHQECFFPVNCAGFSHNPDMANSALFGYTKGSFTGAAKDTCGAFEKADRGTLFLDELGELSLSIQAKLLRVLESNDVIPVGSTEPKTVNVRIIAATNCDMKKMIQEKTFRSDLWFRLNQSIIKLPPLRERTGDIEIFVDEVLSRPHDISNKSLKSLKMYHWPGNVRQLLNVLEKINRGMSVNEALAIEQEFFPDPLSCKGDVYFTRLLEQVSTKRQVAKLETIKKVYMLRVLGIFDGNIAQASRALGIAQNTLRTLRDG